MSVLILKIVAMLTMFLDHVEVVFGVNALLRRIGRMAFPLYTFLVVNGYMHVRDNETRLHSHLLRMLGLALISEIAFDLMNFGVIFDMEDQNQILQFLIVLLAMTIIDMLRKRPFISVQTSIREGVSFVETQPGVDRWDWPEEPRFTSTEAEMGQGLLNRITEKLNTLYEKSKAIHYLLVASVWIAAMVVCNACNIGYYASGIYLAFVYMYYFEHYYNRDYATKLVYLVLTTLSFVLFEWIEIHWKVGINIEMLLKSFDHYFSWYVRNTWAVLGMPLAAAYHGRKGYDNAGFRTFYRLFYPGHQLLLWAIKMISG